MVYLLVFFLLISRIVYCVDTYIYPKPISSNDNRYKHRWELLRTALEKTKKKYGEYIIKESDFTMEEGRELYFLSNNIEINIIRRPTTKDLENNFLAVKIPLLKDILGYRIFLIHKRNVDKLKKVKTLNDLKNFTIGQGKQWNDVRLLEYNGFTVITGIDYEGLFEMLDKGRFDIFSRGINEAFKELEERKNKYRDLMVEENLCLKYPFYEYFFFNKVNKHLAMRVEEGLNIMLKDGSFDEIFNKYFSNDIIKANLRQRKIFYIENPDFPDDVDVNRAEFKIKY